MRGRERTLYGGQFLAALIAVGRVVPCAGQPISSGNTRAAAVDSSDPSQWPRRSMGPRGGEAWFHPAISPEVQERVAQVGAQADTATSAPASQANGAELDQIVLNGRRMVYPVGEPPVARVLQAVFEAGPDSLGPHAERMRRRADCHWEDLTPSAACAELGRAFDVRVVMTDSVRQCQGLVYLRGEGLTLSQALGTMERQLGAAYRWRDDTIVFTMEGETDARDAEGAQSQPRMEVAVKLTGSSPDWASLSERAAAATGCRVSWRGRERAGAAGVAMWADAPAVDVLTACALWQDDPIKIEVVGGHIRLVTSE